VRILTLQPERLIAVKDGQLLEAAGANGLLKLISQTEGIANVMGLHNPTPPQSDSDDSSRSSNNSRFSPLEDDDSYATTDVVPVGEIADESQQIAVIAHANSNEAAGNVQEQDAEPDLEGGIVPQEEDQQPHGVVLSSEADFHKAESK